MTPISRRLVCLLAGAGLATAAGCGRGESVAAPKTAQTNVNPDGRFEFFDLPAGDDQLAVSDTETNTPYGKGVRLPAKYADPQLSGMTVAVAAGDQPPRDFALEAGR